MDGGLTGYSGILFLIHDSTKQATIKWFGPEVKSADKALTEKALAALFKGQHSVNINSSTTVFYTIRGGVSLKILFYQNFYLHSLLCELG